MQTWTSGQTAQKDIQSVIENIFIIKILNTTKKEIQNFKDTIEKVQNANQKIKYLELSTLCPISLQVNNFNINYFFWLLKTLTLDFLGVTLRMVQTIGSLINHINMMIIHTFI